jgi:hypothetical protein
VSPFAVVNNCGSIFRIDDLSGPEQGDFGRIWGWFWADFMVSHNLFEHAIVHTIEPLVRSEN